MERRPAALIVAAILVLATSAVAETDDEYWSRKAAEAQARNIKSYNADPFSVTNSLNAAVHKAMDKKNGTRRELEGGNKGATCKGTNPIDRCWRCKADWAEDRQKLMTCAKGFGRKAFGGGRRGRIYVVTEDSDVDVENPAPGTLRHAVVQDGPLWITFSQDMIIRLKRELMMTSNKTIDGRGHNVRIAYGAGITIYLISNVIVHGIHVHNCAKTGEGFVRDSFNHNGFRTIDDGDGINIYGSSNIWVDHMTMASCSDGLIDVIQGSTAITISNSHFTNHDDVLLFGGSSEFTNDTYMQVTVAFNHFGVGLVQRMPRVRFGFVHIVNNDYTQWQLYPIGGSQHPTIISQGNRFTAPNSQSAKEVTRRRFVELLEADFEPESTWRQWNWKSEKDIYRNGAFFRSSGVVREHRVFDFTKNFSHLDVFSAKRGSYVNRLTRYAGALACRSGVPC